MAEFRADGIDGLMLSLEDVANMPEEVQDKMLNAGADALIPGQKACRVIVPDDQLSLAIGKEGQNARLAAKLTGFKIDIKA